MLPLDPACVVLLALAPAYFAQLAVTQMSSTQAAATPKPLGITMDIVSRAVLSEQPLLLIEREQMNVSQALLLQASAAFDTMIGSQLLQSWTTTPLTVYQEESVASPGFQGNFERSSQTVLTASLTRTFRTGVTLGGSLEINRLLDNISDPEGNNFSTVALTVNLPFLRNRGRSVVGAQETAAREEIGATRRDLLQQASQLLANGAASYWHLVADEQLVAIARQSEDRALVYRDNVQTLVTADQVPHSDLSQVEANLAQRSSARISAEQDVAGAQQQLAVDLGVTLAELTGISLEPGETFPPIPPESEVASTLVNRLEYLTTAFDRRGDYLAALQRIEEQKVLTIAAKNRIKPQLDLGGTAGYAGLQAGRKFANALDSAGSGIRGPNAQASLTFTFPAGNEAARGILMQTTANERQAELAAEQLRHQIATEVNTALSALVHASGQVFQATRSVQASQAALDGEREKYRVGMGSVVDLVTVEDRLNSALVDQVGARLAYALALAQLRFATSTFLDQDGIIMQLRPQAFESMPLVASSRDGSTKY